ncbi:MAG: aryl-sulfate sulfotransferase [Bacteroidota bacterium]
MRKIRLFFFLLHVFDITISWSQDRTVGLVDYSPMVSDGYLLLSSTHSSNSYLLNTCGEVVHIWYSDYFPGNTVRLMPDGNLLRATKTKSSFFLAGGAGGRIEILDWDSNLLWEYTYSTESYRHHHDVVDLPNGNILILAWDRRSKETALQAGRNPDNLGNINEDVWGEHVLEIKPMGTNEFEIVWEWYLWDHLIQDFDETQDNFGVVEQHPELVDINYDVDQGNPDWIHANGIDYNAALDQVVISSRNLSEFWVIDHSTTTEEAKSHTGGNSGMGGDIIYRFGNPQVSRQEGSQELFSQHHVNWAKLNGRDDVLTLFNNGNDRVPQYSSVDFYLTPFSASEMQYERSGSSYSDPKLLLTYRSDEIEQFNYSNFLSGVQLLPDGHILICSGSTGSIIELDTNGTVVWQYINPITSSGIKEQGFDIINTAGISNLVFRAYKYELDYPAFLNKQFTNNSELEANPFPLSLCDEVLDVEGFRQSVVEIYPNPTSNFINIVGADNNISQVVLRNLQQADVLNISDNDIPSILDLNCLDPGLYFLNLYTKKGDLIVEKLIKK